MTVSIYLETVGDEIEIEDPENSAHWIEALTPYCKQFAEENYSFQYYVDRDGLSDETLAKASEKIAAAIKSFKTMTLDEKYTPEQQWGWVLGEALMEAVEGITNEFTQDDALHENRFQRLYEDLDEAMGEIDGPVCDLESLFDSLKSMTVEFMEEHDTSTPDEMFSSQPVRLIFAPGSDLTIGSGYDQKIEVTDLPKDGPDENLKHLLALTKCSGSILLAEDTVIDYRDVITMRRWDRILNIKGSADPLLDREQFFNILDNASGGLAIWAGELSIRELKSINFREDVHLSGGLIGLHDSSNGSGYLIENPGTIVVEAQEFMGYEHGYTIDETYGFVNRVFETSIEAGRFTEEAPSPRKIFSQDSPEL